MVYLERTHLENTRVKAKGFTLLELLAALAIVAVLAAIALPLYNQFSDRSYRAEVQADLLNCAQALERFSAVNFTYAGTADTDADGVADGDAGAIGEDICDARSVAGDRYDITIAAAVTTYTLTAAPDANGPMVGDGDLTLDDAGNRTWDQNDNNVIDADEDDWNED